MRVFVFSTKSWTRIATDMCLIINFGSFWEVYTTHTHLVNQYWAIQGILKISSRADIGKQDHKSLLTRTSVDIGYANLHIAVKRCKAFCRGDLGLSHFFLKIWQSEDLFCPILGLSNLTIRGKLKKRIWQSEKSWKRESDNQRKVEKENLTIRGKWKKRIWQSEESEKVKVRIILGCMEQCEQELCFCIESENNLKK